MGGDGCFLSFSREELTMSGTRLRFTFWMVCAVFSLLLLAGVSADGSRTALANAPLDKSSGAPAVGSAPIYMVPPIDDGFDKLPDYLKARSYSGLVKAGLVHPAG